MPFVATEKIQLQLVTLFFFSCGQFEEISSFADIKAWLIGPMVDTLFSSYAEATGQQIPNPINRIGARAETQKKGGASAWLEGRAVAASFSPACDLFFLALRAGGTRLGSGLLRVTPVMLRQWRVKTTSRSWQRCAVCMDVCIDICINMCVCMCIDMGAGMRIVMCVAVCTVMYA